MAVGSFDDGVRGNSDSDSAQHSRCTNEYDLLTGQESRSSGILCGSNFTTHTHGEISFSGKCPSGNATAFFFKYTPTCVFEITSDRVNVLRVRTRVNEIMSGEK